MNKRTIVVSIALLILPLTMLLGQYKYSEKAFESGEKLVYSVAYKWSFINKEVATATFTVDTKDYEGRPSYHVNAQAITAKSFNWFFELDDRYVTVLDTDNLRPLKATSEISEGKYRYSSRYEYDWGQDSITTYSRNHKHENETIKTMPLSQNSFDGLAIFYNLRSTDMAQMELGSTLELVISDTIRHIKYEFLGREEKRVPRLGTFNTLKFSCELATSSGESFDDGDEFFMWVSDDQNKIPLYFESPIRVGKVRAYIDSYSNLKYPMTSKIK